MRISALLTRCAVGVLALFPLRRADAAAPRFEVSIAQAAHRSPVTGRLVLIVSKTKDPEPRYLVSPQGPAIFGVDLEQVEPGRPVTVDQRAIGYPWPLTELPPGDYFVQAVVNLYEQVHRADGHTVWLPMNDGTVEFFTTAQGNLYSEPQAIHVGANTGPVRVVIDKVIPRQEQPTDTEWLKTVTIQSQKLTAFWGRPTYIHATVLLPKGYAEHPDVRYPSIYALGHGNAPFGFTPDSAHSRGVGQINPVTGLESGYDFYKAWTGAEFPRVIAITLQQQTPYFPDSYSVNSANNGPYGDAIVEEIIPALEKQFRIVGAPYGRHLEGASTSGWQTLALQLRNPDFFGGAWVLQPDPIDFRRYQLVDIYKDDNAFVQPAGQFTTIERPFRRSTEGQPLFSVRQLSRFEEVLGSKGRSGYQLEAWEAVYGPVGPDGYPKPLWNKLTGAIDHDVALYMRDHGYDLRYYAEQNWATLGPKLAGKLHIFSGDMDDFYLNLAVYQFEDFLKSTTNPKSDAEFTFGRPKKGHSWHTVPWAEMVRRIVRAVETQAPPDVARRWHYE
jgi:hypothetical protein